LVDLETAELPLAAAAPGCTMTAAIAAALPMSTARREETTGFDFSLFTIVISSCCILQFGFQDKPEAST
jgi:hypothetical protein